MDKRDLEKILRKSGVSQSIAKRITFNIDDTALEEKDSTIDDLLMVIKIIQLQTLNARQNVGFVRQPSNSILANGFHREGELQGNGQGMRD